MAMMLIAKISSHCIQFLEETSVYPSTKAKLSEGHAFVLPHRTRIVSP
ncbi:MAG: hypothetical protein ACI9VM_000835 [Candidatus Azotimanducaceae bacterium]|jgi:hypothetical protein